MAITDPNTLYGLSAAQTRRLQGTANAADLTNLAYAETQGWKPETPKTQEIPGVGTLTVVPKTVVQSASAATVTPDATADASARANVPPLPAATPPNGATLIGGPSGLQGLNESQIWRDPSSNKIYRLPQVEMAMEKPVVAKPEAPAITAPKQPEYASPAYQGAGDTERQKYVTAYNAIDEQLKSLEAMVQQGYTPTQEELALANEYQKAKENLRAFDTATLQRTEVMEGTGRGRTVTNVQLAQDKERRMRALERLGFAQEAETLSERLTATQDQRKGLLDSAMAFFQVSSKRLDSALGLTKELASIDKQQRDDARAYLLDMVDWAQGLTWEELDADTQAKVTASVAESPLSLQMVKQALKVGKEKMYAGGEDMNKLLTPSEASQLGVPYGTTVGQAAQLGISPSGGLTEAQASTLESVTTKFQSDAVMKIANDAQVASQIADQVIANPSGGPEQIAALYSFIKTLDPTSAVREGEIALATETQSYLSTWKTEISKIIEGKTLDPATARKLALATHEISRLWMQVGERRITQYKAQASVLGVGTQFDSYLGMFSPIGSVKPPQNDEEEEYINGRLDGTGGNLASGSSTGGGGGGSWGGRTGGSVSWRMNNPLNIKYGPYAEKFGAKAGVKATDGGVFAFFPDEATGIRAAKNLLRSPSYAELPLTAAMRRWSGGGYGAEVAPEDLRGKFIGQMTDAEVDRLIEAMRKREGWTAGKLA